MIAPITGYGTFALTAAEAPAEFVIVTETEATLETFPVMVNGIVSANCDPVASDAGFEYQVAKSVLTSTVTLVVCSVAPAAGVNWNVAVFMSSVVEYPATITCKPFDVVVTDTLEITGAEAAMVVVADGGTVGVIFTPAALSESDSSILPASVPVWNWSVALVVPAGMVICVVREPLENIRSLELPGFGVMESVAVTVSGSE